MQTFHGNSMKRTVLVIDDNPDLLDMVDAILSQSSFFSYALLNLCKMR